MAMIVTCGESGSERESRERGRTRVRAGVSRVRDQWGLSDCSGHTCWHFMRIVQGLMGETCMSSRPRAQ